MNRRRFLEWSSAAFAVGAAGCSTIGSEERDGVILTHVELGNASSEARTFDLVVTYDDEFHHWNSYEVGPRIDERELGGRVIRIDAPEEPGSVDVYVRVRDRWKRTDFDTARYDGERVIALVTYGLPEDGVLRLSRVVSDRPTTPAE